MAQEFEAIRQFFQAKTPLQQPFTSLGNGDDASVHEIPQGLELVVSTDAAVSGVHWPVDMPLDVAAKRAVCAALSDLAAMGAKATWIWLSVVAKDMPSLAAMGDGVADVCQHYQIELAGGDTVHAAHDMISVTVAGLLPRSQAMTRKDAQVGDDVWLCGDLGLSAQGLQQWLAGDLEASCIQYFQTITPLLLQGEELRNMGVRCCMDVSDGLLQDAAHLCCASKLAITFDVAKLKKLPSYQILSQSMADDAVLRLVVAGGEDYALLFTAPVALRDALQAWGAYRIGVCASGQGVQVMENGQLVHIETQGYDHFA